MTDADVLHKVLLSSFLIHVHADSLRQFFCHKIHSWRGKYHRIFGLKKNSFLNIDPKDFVITNEWPYSDVIDMSPVGDNPTEFIITLPKEGSLGLFQSL
jgi:hypothetical protein